MAFRERIEAVLKVKDAARFKAGMATAAKAVQKFAHEEDNAAAQTELLETIVDKLEDQSYRTAAAIELLSASVDDLGDEMRQTAASATVMNVATKKSGSNAVFLGKSWAFWKDRLSITRSEILSTAYTIGAYFTPAIIAMGSSFANAAIGGGAVAGGGLASFIFGLGLLSTVVKPVIENIKQVDKAHEQYVRTVEEYGAASSQASRASAHMGAIIRTHGGQQTAKAVVSLQKMAKSWRQLTAPARRDVMGTMLSGLTQFSGVERAFAGMTNRIASALRTALEGAFKDLARGELADVGQTLTKIFTKSIGPGVRGFVNMFVVLGRIIKASAPWVIKWAKSWEDVTDDWRRSTSDQRKVNEFINKAVRSFKLWWGLAKELGRTLKIIFGATKGEGDKIVITLTNLVEKFNDWLQKASDTGKIDEFFRKYNQSVEDAVWALQNPIQAINKWLPQVMDAIATGMATHAPKAAEVFIKAFLNSGSWAQFLTIIYFAKRLGLFRALFGAIGAKMVGPFFTAFIAGLAPKLAAAGAAEGALSTAATTAGTRLGLVFWGSFASAMFLIILAPMIQKWINDALEDIGVSKDKPDWFPSLPTDKNILEKGKESLDAAGQLLKKFGIVGGQTGGVIPVGGASLVGEAGPEIARAGPHGTTIRPLSGNSRHTLPGVMDIPDLENAINLNIRTSVQVNKREIMRAYNDERSFVSSRRGGAAPSE